MAAGQRPIASAPRGDAGGDEVREVTVRADDAERGVAGADQLAGEFDDALEGGIEAQLAMHREDGVIEAGEGPACPGMVRNPIHAWNVSIRVCGRGGDTRGAVA